MNVNSNKKKAIIIGASSGIGKELAKILIENNYNVGLTGRRSDLLIEFKNIYPNSTSIKIFDITDTTKVTKNLEELCNELGGLDLLIISSGTGNINESLDFGIEKSTIETNVIGFTCAADWAFNHFEKQKFGHLVSISSIAGIRGSRQSPSYNSTKAYQINYLEGLMQKAKKLKQAIYVTDIRPGFVDTAMAKSDVKFWVSTADKAAKQIFDGIKKKKKVLYVSKRWRIIAIILKLIPKSIYVRM